MQQIQNIVGILRIVGNSDAVADLRNLVVDEKGKRYYMSGFRVKLTCSRDRAILCTDSGESMQKGAAFPREVAAP